jgi:hypothetical protein
MSVELKSVSITRRCEDDREYLDYELNMYKHGKTKTFAGSKERGSCDPLEPLFLTALDEIRGFIKEKKYRPTG